MLSVAVNVAQIVFYSLGSVALVVGGGLGIRRFLFERPHVQSWALTVREGRVRRIDSGERSRFFHDVQVTVRNESLAFQSVERYWIGVFPPGHPDFDGARFHAADKTSVGMSQFFCAPSFARGGFVAPGGEVMLGKTLEAKGPIPVLRVCHAVQTRRPRLVRPGFHRDSIVVA